MNYHVLQLIKYGYQILGPALRHAMPPCLICITNNSIRGKTVKWFTKGHKPRKCKKCDLRKKKRISARPQNSPIQPSPLTLSLLFCPWYVRQPKLKTQENSPGSYLRTQGSSSHKQIPKKQQPSPVCPGIRGFPGDSNFRAKTKSPG